MVVLVGDIGKLTYGIYWARGVFPDKAIVYVPGNHEYYGTQRRETLAATRNAASECGIHFLDDDDVVINPQAAQDSVRFLGCTLWTDFRFFGDEMKQQAMLDRQNGLNDFRLIREGDEHFSPAHSIELHEKSLAWLKQMLAMPFQGKTVVVTHHLPSARSVAERFKNSPLSACFVSKLDYLFGKMDMCIHAHDNFDYEVNGTRVICNPRGYVTQQGAENANFKPGLVVEM